MIANLRNHKVTRIVFYEKLAVWNGGFFIISQQHPLTYNAAKKFSLDMLLISREKNSTRSLSLECMMRYRFTKRSPLQPNGVEIKYY